MGHVKAGLSQSGDKLFLVFEAEETTGIEMDLDTAIQVFGLLYELIEEAKGLAALKTAPTDGRST